MCILVPAPLKTTVDTLNRQANAKNAPGILAIQEISGKLSLPELNELFNKVTFAPNETDDVKKLINIGPGDTFNLSAKEIAMVKKQAESVKAGSNAEAAAKAMAKAMGEVLKNRYLSYYKEGLKGPEPYQLDASKQVAPAEELISATESLAIVKERFPAYYRCLRMYPDQGVSKFVHQYFWVKQQEGNRPMLVLKHWVLDVQADYALITERQYYLSNTLSSLQVVIGCLPYRSSTLVVLLNQAFTEMVNLKIGKTIAKSFGRKEVEKKIRPMFENLRTSLAK